MKKHDGTFFFFIILFLYKCATHNLLRYSRRTQQILAMNGKPFLRFSRLLWVGIEYLVVNEGQASD